MEVKSVNSGAPVKRFCADFMSGRVQIETLPMSSCELPDQVAEEVSLMELAEELYDPEAQAVELDDFKWRMKNYGAVTLGFLGSLAAGGVAMGPRVAHPLRHLLLGLDSMADDPFDASERRQAAQVVMHYTMKDTHDDLKNMTDGVSKCIFEMKTNFRKQMDSTAHRLQSRMQTKDFNRSLNNLFSSTQYRLGEVLDYLSVSTNIATWLVASVEEGLHTCIDVGSLVDLVTDSTIVAAMQSLAVVNRWFTMCVAFINLSKRLQHFDVGGVAFNARYRTGMFLGRNFLNFYKATRLVGEATLSKVSASVRPFELRVHNYLNLVSVKHYHAVNDFDFPHRQGGIAVPNITAGYSARVYSVGASRQFQKTCRFCRQDGTVKVHYGCWEEEALSLDRCVISGGIFYNASLPLSNEYSCVQKSQFDGRTSTCGGRPQQ